MTPHLSKNREWFIQKYIANNCPVGQSGSLENQGAVFTSFMPTVAMQNCEWVHVIEYSAYAELLPLLDEAISTIERRMNSDDKCGHPYDEDLGELIKKLKNARGEK